MIKKQPRKVLKWSHGLHFFMIHAIPARKRSSEKKVGGAFVNCWINFPHVDGALCLAKYYLRTAGWRFRKLEEQKWITRNDFRGQKSLQYFDEAAIDGASFVFHQYPVAKHKRPPKATSKVGRGSK